MSAAQSGQVQVHPYRVPDFAPLHPGYALPPSETKAPPHSLPRAPRGDFAGEAGVVGPDQIQQQRRLVVRLQHLRVALLGALHLPPFLRRYRYLAEVIERTRKLLAVGPGKSGAMVEPVKSGDDRDRQIVHGVAGEFDHRFLVRQLAKIGVQYRLLQVRLGEQREFAPRHHQQIAHGFQPRVVTDRSFIAPASDEVRLQAG